MHAQWIAFLEHFDFLIKHTIGKTNKAADALNCNLGTTEYIHIGRMFNMLKMFSRKGVMGEKVH